MRSVFALASLLFAASALAEDAPVPAAEPAPAAESAAAPASKILAPTKHNAGREHVYPLTDSGVALQLDPYVNDVGLTPAPMQRFRKIYVDPQTYASTLNPAKPAAVARPDKVGPFPDGGIGAGQKVKLEMDRRLYPENIVALGDVAKAIEAAGVGKVETAGPDTLLVTLGDQGAPALFGFIFREIKGKPRRVTDVATLWLPAPPPAVPVTPEPEPAAPANVKGKGAPPPPAPVEPAPVVPEWVAAVIEPAALPEPITSGVLTVSNRRSSWAEVSINGTKVGIVGPYTDAYILNAKAGTYDVQLRLTNGYTWTQPATTAPAQPEWPTKASGMSQRQPVEPAKN